jgi:probable F420-dependent oxidoreductase
VRFGVVLNRVASGSEWKALARRAEQLSYDTLSLPDHLAGMGSPDRLAPFPALAVAAAVTDRIRVGTMVLSNDFRHPAFVAKEIATLDVLSGGRVELGVGAGWDETEYRQAGLAFDQPAIRIARLFESIAIMKQLFSGDPVSFVGDHYAVNGLKLGPRPVQAGGPPILVGGGGERLLRGAARIADGISLMSQNDGGINMEFRGTRATRETVRQRVGLIKSSAGSRFDSLTLNCRILLTMVTGNREAAASDVGPSLGIDPADLLESPFALLGTERQMADELLRRRDELAITYVTVSQSALEAFAPVIELIGER